MYLNLNNEYKDFLRNQLEDYLQSNGVDTHKPKFQCLICGSKDGANFVPDTNHTRWKCFSANHSRYPKDSGDIIEYVQQLENVDFKEALKLLKYKYNIADYTPKPRKPVDTTTPEELEFVNNEIQKMLEFAKTMIGTCNYLTKRGISIEVQKRYNIGFCANFVHPKSVWKHRNEPHWKGYASPRIIIPTSPTSLLARAIRPQDEGENGKYKALKIGSTHVFNSDVLKQNIGYCYIFEGEIDALSAIECGFNAVGIGSTSMLDKFFKEYKINAENVLIIAMDNDQGGQEAIPKAVELCKRHKIAHIVADSNQLFNSAKDCNQALQDNRTTLTNNLETLKNEALKFDKMAYLKALENERPQSAPPQTTPTPTITYENIKSKEVLECAYTLNSETDIAQYFDMLLTKASEFKLTGFKSLIAPYRNRAKTLLRERHKKEQKTNNNGVVWDTNQFGELSGTLNNYVNILSLNDEYKQNLSYNELNCKIYYKDTPITDNWITQLRLDFRKKYNITNTTKSEVMDAINFVAKENSYHPIRKYIDSLPKWDNVPRLETLFIDYLGAEDTPYTRKIAKITMISAVARVKKPSCFVDTITCLVGQQGIGKSKFIGKLAVQDDWFTDGVTSFDGKEFYEGIQGKWIIELGEGTAFKKSTKEIAKQRASATKDTYRLPYAILPEDRPRQCIFIATVNDYKFLKDETGNRRYYPIDCDKSKAKYTFNDLTPEVVAQIWAEALMYHTQGEKWYLDENEKDILEVAIREQEKHYENSTLYDDIYNYLTIKVPSNWESIEKHDRRYHIQAVLDDAHPRALDGTPLRLDETCTRNIISIDEIIFEYYEKEQNELFSGRDKLRKDITRTLKELGYVSNGRNYVRKYGKVTTYIKK